MAGPLSSRLDFHVTNGPIGVPKVMDLNLVAEFVFVNVIVLHRTWKSTYRSSRDRASRFGATESPFAWITVLNHVVHINVSQRVFLWNAAHVPMSSAVAGIRYTLLMIENEKLY
jgi:hypothetical protein